MIKLLFVVYTLSWLPWWVIPAAVWLLVAVAAGGEVVRVARVARAHSTSCTSAPPVEVDAPTIPLPIVRSTP